MTDPVTPTLADKHLVERAAFVVILENESKLLAEVARVLGECGKHGSLKAVLEERIALLNRVTRAASPFASLIVAELCWRHSLSPGHKDRKRLTESRTAFEQLAEAIGESAN